MTDTTAVVASTTESMPIDTDHGETVADQSSALSGSAAAKHRVVDVQWTPVEVPWKEVRIHLVPWCEQFGNVTNMYGEIIGKDTPCVCVVFTSERDAQEGVVHLNGMVLDVRVSATQAVQCRLSATISEVVIDDADDADDGGEEENDNDTPQEHAERDESTQSEKKKKKTKSEKPKKAPSSPRSNGASKAKKSNLFTTRKVGDPMTDKEYRQYVKRMAKQKKEQPKWGEFVPRAYSATIIRNIGRLNDCPIIGDDTKDIAAIAHQAIVNTSVKRQLLLAGSKHDTVKIDAKGKPNAVRLSEENTIKAARHVQPTHVIAGVPTQFKRGQVNKAFQHVKNPPRRAVAAAAAANGNGHTVHSEDEEGEDSNSEEDSDGDEVAESDDDDEYQSPDEEESDDDDEEDSDTASDSSASSDGAVRIAKKRKQKASTKASKKTTSKPRVKAAKPQQRKKSKKEIAAQRRREEAQSDDEEEQSDEEQESDDSIPASSRHKKKQKTQSNKSEKKAPDAKHRSKKHKTK